ncbi:hypothetical protein HJG60_007800 [Phyllostomus discolor]|uniref:Uncharacterized protein n=1 Tax=Phyllostomus discolor TaxID=89673 RepID=A0A834EY60_9CHIR|nr:hypothetical protein HJG60_007800 [Phyllostomus discolor]
MEASFALTLKKFKGSGPGLVWRGRHDVGPRLSLSCCSITLSTLPPGAEWWLRSQPSHPCCSQQEREEEKGPTVLKDVSWKLCTMHPITSHWPELRPAATPSYTGLCDQIKSVSCIDKEEEEN